MQPVHCSPSAFGLLLHRNRSLALLSAAGLPSSAFGTPAAAALPSSSSRQLAGLPLLFLWASKSDVRHFAPPLNPPRGFKPFPAPLAVLLHRSLALPLRQAGAWGESLWNVHRRLLLHRNRSLALPANPPQRLWPTPAPQPCPLPLLGSSQACLFSSYGLPKATLGTFCTAFKPPARLQTLPSAFGVLLHRSLASASSAFAYSCCVRREPGERASGTCIAALPASGGSLGREPLERAALHCSPSAFGLLLHRNRSLALLSAAGLPSAAPANPSQRLWPTPAAQPCLVRREPQPGTCPSPIGSRPALRSACKPFPAPLAYSCSAALPASGGSLGREPWNVQPVLLWASKSDVRHFAPPSNPPPRLQTLPSALPSPAASNPSQRLWPTPASQPCLRQAGAWGESLWNVQPVHCSPSAFGLLLHRNRSLALLSAAGLPSAAPANPPQRLWPTPAPQPCPLPLLGSSQACLFSSYGLPKATLGTLHRL